MVDCQPVFELLFIKFTEYLNIACTTDGVNQVDVVVKFFVGHSIILIRAQEIQ
jgi:hypothetical protein